MPKPSQLPSELPATFSVAEAVRAGVSPMRLRASDLASPRRGVRTRLGARSEGGGGSAPNRFERHRRDELERILQVARILAPHQFFSHRSAARLWGAPVPYEPGALVHASVLDGARAPQISGVIGHSLLSERCRVLERNGISLADPASTWAQLGRLPLVEIVALGDYFVRVHREGYGRRNVGMPPFATLADLAGVLELGRWQGSTKLRRALGLIREDSWSPQESRVRVELVLAGVPEPELNGDVFDGRGVFLGCVDLLFRRYRVGVEYQGGQHSESYAADVERLAALRADHWSMIEVTSALARRPTVMAGRVLSALRERGWPGEPRVPNSIGL